MVVPTLVLVLNTVVANIQAVDRCTRVVVAAIQAVETVIQVVVEAAIQVLVLNHWPHGNNMSNKTSNSAVKVIFIYSLIKSILFGLTRFMKIKKI